jgi:hypothetical protein
VPASVKRIAGKGDGDALDRSSVVAPSSRRAFLPFMNFSRAGVAKKRSRTSTVVPRIGRCRPHWGDTLPPTTADLGGAVGRRRAGRLVIVSLRHGADRGQGLAAKAERADVEQRVGGEFGGAVARQWQAPAPLRPHAAAVVGDAHAAFLPPPAVADLDAGGAGVERILDQFLRPRWPAAR